MACADGGRAVFYTLQTCLIERRFQSGCSFLQQFLEEEVFQPASLEFGIPILFCLAQWIDLGYKGAVSLEELMAAFDPASRASVSIGDFLQLRMIEGLSCMRTQKVRHAAFLLNSVIECGEAVLSPYQQFVAQFWLGRAQRLAGDFDASLLHIGKARDLAISMEASRLVAVVRIHESWLVFHKGEQERALKLLDLAEDELQTAGHALSLANISAARGRFIRSSGQYAESLRHYTRSIELYSIDHADHPNLARALVNAAYVKRLMALELQPHARGGAANAKTHRHAQRIAEEALELLERAAAIYGDQQHDAGMGAVLVNQGYLHLESGDIERAALAAQEAFRTGERRPDLVLMARARILEASVELASCEEQLEDEQSGPGRHAALAVKHSEQAIALAGQTQNRRLLAASYIVRGLIATEESNFDWTLARNYAGKASALISGQDQDHLFRELRGLNLRISRSAAIDETLRAWCDGNFAGRTFQQIQEEFAEIIIPRVWIKLDKKVSRVAQELSVSPKKVRRILRTAREIPSS